MDSASTKIRMATLPKRHSRRLLFDRRYGWVFDEWKDPSEEALAGGRGMFCMLPLAKAFLTAASQSPRIVKEMDSSLMVEARAQANSKIKKRVRIDHTANFAVKVFDSPDLLSSQALQTSLRNQLNKFKSSIKKAESNSFALEEHSFQAPTSPPHLLFENKKSQID